MPIFSTLTIGFPIDQVVVGKYLYSERTLLSVIDQTAEVLIDEDIGADEEYCITFTGGLKNANNLEPPTSSFSLTTSNLGAGIDELDNGIIALPALNDEMCLGVVMTEQKWWNVFLLNYFCN